MLLLSFIVCKMFQIEMCMTLSLISGMGHGQMYVFQSKGHMRLSYVLAILMIVQSITVCDIFTVEMCMTLTLILGKGQM